MQVTWLHVSDFHIQAGDPYDRNVVLGALVRSVKGFRERGRAPDLVFATGDVAYSGKAAEYEIATVFFDALLEAAGVDRQRLFVVPGNHDVDRGLAVGLARTLESRERADAYFAPHVPKPHLTQKQGAFVHWHHGYFKGIRTLPADSTCGPVELVELRGARLGILPVNSAFFCEDHNDHAKLWIGRRCVGPALEQLRSLGGSINVGLVHHPLDWLHDEERANIKAELHAHVHLVLRGHLHENDVESVVTASGGAVHVAAGAAYQTRKWPNRALYASLDGDHLTLFPIRYEDQPREVWTVDPSLFPNDAGHEKSFTIPRLAAVATLAAPRATPFPATPPAPAPAPPPAQPARFRSNVPSRGQRPFVGRDTLLEDILAALGDPQAERVLVLHGAPGVGKSELAREAARRQRDRYPGGTFFVDAGMGAPFVDLARIGANVLDLGFPPDLPLQDQCERTLLSLGAAPTLLIYDNVVSAEPIARWLPRAGMPCHVLITSVAELSDPAWASLSVEPLSLSSAFELIACLAGRQVAERWGADLAQRAEGLPVQICSEALTLAYEARRGRLDSVDLALTDDTRKSFGLVYERLEPPVRLLLRAAAFLNCRRVPRDELSRHLREGAGWTDTDFRRALDACLDLHLLEDGAELRMHQLFASFVLARPASGYEATAIEKIRDIQRRRLVELASELADRPADSALASAVLAFPLDPQAWKHTGTEVPIEGGDTLGRALCEIGHFDEARPWFERAVEAAQQGDVHGRVDHASLGISLHQVGDCLSSTGKFDEARPWFERAVEAKQQGDVHGRVDHASLRTTLIAGAVSLRHLGQHAQAQAWEDRASSLVS